MKYRFFVVPMWIIIVVLFSKSVKSRFSLYLRLDNYSLNTVSNTSIGCCKPFLFCASCQPMFFICLAKNISDCFNPVLKLNVASFDNQSDVLNGQISSKEMAFPTDQYPVTSASETNVTLRMELVSASPTRPSGSIYNLTDSVVFKSNSKSNYSNTLIDKTVGMKLSYTYRIDCSEDYVGSLCLLYCKGKFNSNHECTCLQNDANICPLNLPLNVMSILTDEQLVQVQSTIVSLFNYTNAPVTVTIKPKSALTTTNNDVTMLLMDVSVNSIKLNWTTIEGVLNNKSVLWLNKYLPTPIYLGELKKNIPDPYEPPQTSKIIYIAFVVFLVLTFFIAALSFLIRHFKKRRRHRMLNGISSFSLTSLDGNAAVNGNSGLSYVTTKTSKVTTEFSNPVYKYRSADHTLTEITSDTTPVENNSSGVIGGSCGQLKSSSNMDFSSDNYMSPSPNSR